MLTYGAQRCQRRQPDHRENIARQRHRAVWAWFCLSLWFAGAALPGLLQPVCAAESTRGYLEVHVEADSLPNASGLYWKVIKHPAPQVVLRDAVDEPLRQTVQQELDRLLQQDQPWRMDFGPPSLINHLRDARPLAHTALRFDETAALDRPDAPRTFSYAAHPARGSTPKHLFVYFTYGEHITDLLIDVRSQGVPENPDRQQFAFEELPLPQDLRQTLSPAAQASVGAHVRFHLWGSAPQFGAGEEARLLKVARYAFSVAQEEGVLPGGFQPSDEAAGRPSARIYQGLIPSPPASEKSVTFIGGDAVAGPWLFRIRNIVPIRSVRVEARYDLPTLLTPGTRLAQATQNRLQQAAVKAAAEVEKRFATAFAEQRGSVLTPEEQAEILQRLKGDDPRIAHADPPRFEDGVLIYPVVIAPTIKTLVGSLGAGYNPHERFTGKGDLTETNLLGLREDASLALKGGDHTQHGDFVFNLYPHWFPDDRWTSHFSVRGLYSRVEDIVLGTVDASGTERERSARVYQSLIFRPLAPKSLTAPAAASVPLSGPDSAERPQNRLRVTDAALGLAAEFGPRDVKLTGVTPPPGIVADGLIAPLTLTFAGSASVERPGTGRGQFRGVALSLVSSYEHAYRVLGADHQYDQWSVQGSVEARFGAVPNNDFFLRYLHGFATTSGGTPLFRFLRVGGEANVRGVEEGEFIGRTLYYQQVEAGISLWQIRRLIVGKEHTLSGGPANSPTGDQPSSQVGPLNLAKTFIKLFFDHAELSERVVASQLVRSAQSIQGYGIALELRELAAGAQKIGLSLGYAYSPDSRRHSSGIVFTQVALPFSLL